MTLREVAQVLDARVVCGDKWLDRQVEYACASDLMSDILTLDPPHVLLITGLINVQTIRTAEMAESQGVLFVRNKKVNDEMVQLACESNIVLLEYSGTMYKACGLLYNAGLKPVF
jgi:predicted transcriptional regulator